MIKIENLAFSYTKKQPLFRELFIDIPAGNIYGLLGKNGAGKSTFLYLVSGLLFPKNGTIDIMGFQPKDRVPEFLREIYLVSEEFSLPGMRMERFVRLYSPFYPRFNHNLFDEYLNEFKLPRDKKLTALSYGQKKNFLLSFGLATDCKLLILDEPTNGLDIPSKSQFRKLVANAIHEDRTFIISTHQVRDMENLIDPIIILDEGEVVFYRNTGEISSKLVFARQTEAPDIHKVIYSESSLTGYTVLKKNPGTMETNINLELLFNAVISNSEKVETVFNA